jgi:hypothetical protein
MRAIAKEVDRVCKLDRITAEGHARAIFAARRLEADPRTRGFRTVLPP